MLKKHQRPQGTSVKTVRVSFGFVYTFYCSGRWLISSNINQNKRNTLRKIIWYFLLFWEMTICELDVKLSIKDHKEHQTKQVKVSSTQKWQKVRKYLWDSGAAPSPLERRRHCCCCSCSGSRCCCCGEVVYWRILLFLEVLLILLLLLIM